VVGHKNSGPSKAAAPVYARAGLPQVTQCSTDNSLSRSGWRTFFRLCADNERQAEVAAMFAHRRLPDARAFAVHDGTDYGRPLVEAFARRFEELGGRPVRVLGMRVGQEDFSEVVGQIRAGNADIVDVGATEIESSKLMKALHAAGVRPLVISSEGGPDNPIVRLAGAAGEGSVHLYAGSDPTSTAASRDLVKRCRDAFGETPSYVVECYDAVSVIAAALERGAANRAELRRPHPLRRQRRPHRCPCEPVDDPGRGDGAARRERSELDGSLLLQQFADVSEQRDRLRHPLVRNARVLDAEHDVQAITGDVAQPAQVRRNLFR